jgi:hypothetical protein
MFGKITLYINHDSSCHAPGYHLKALQVERKVEDVDIGDGRAWGSENCQRSHKGENERHFVALNRDICRLAGNELTNRYARVDFNAGVISRQARPLCQNLSCSGYCIRCATAIHIYISLLLATKGVSPRAVSDLVL